MLGQGDIESLIRYKKLHQTKLDCYNVCLSIIISAIINIMNHIRLKFSQKKSDSSCSKKGPKRASLQDMPEAIVSGFKLILLILRFEAFPYMINIMLVCKYVPYILCISTLHTCTNMMCMESSHQRAL